MTNKEENQGWNKRCVDFSKVHGNEEDAFSYLVEALGLQSGMTVGDIMCGYGAVSKKVLDYCAKKNLFVRLVLSDAFKEQIARTYDYLAPYDIQGYCIQRKTEDSRCLSLEAILDKAIIKMGLHEVRKSDQSTIIRNIHNALKQNGELYIWETFGQDTILTNYFRAVVRKKDELAGFTSLVENRYFPCEQEMIEMLKEEGFREITPIYEGDFIYNTRNMLESDFQGDINKLNTWNTYLRENLPEQVKKAINFQDNGESISMKFVKKIIRAKK